MCSERVVELKKGASNELQKHASGDSHLEHASFCIKMHHFLQSSQLREPIETRRDRAQWRTTAHSQLTRRTAQSDLNKQSQPARLYATPEFL